MFPDLHDELFKEHGFGKWILGQFPATPATKETETLPTETPEAQTEAPSGAMAIQGSLHSLMRSWAPDLKSWKS